MKKAAAAVLVIVTTVFLAFTAGVFFGRNRIPDPVLPQQDTTASVSAFLPSSPSQPDSGKLNINTATVQQLDELPGIGPVLAQRIVDYRTQNGPFSALADLGDVEGIGPERLMLILEWISLEG